MNARSLWVEGVEVRWSVSGIHQDTLQDEACQLEMDRTSSLLRDLRSSS